MSLKFVEFFFQNFFKNVKKEDCMYVCIIGKTFEAMPLFLLRYYRTFSQKEALAAEWRQLQEIEKNEEINVAYCYWDGSSHRKNMKVKKGATISQFLQRSLEVVLSRKFNKYHKVILLLKNEVKNSLKFFQRQKLIIESFFKLTFVLANFSIN